MTRRFMLSMVALLALLQVVPAMAQGVLRIGFFPGPYADQFKRGVQPTLEKAGIKVQATEFSNIIQLNSALMDGSLDANVFQNRAFMESFNTQYKATLEELLQVPSAPLGLYSSKVKDLKALATGASIAIPNDPTSMGRALAFIQSHAPRKRTSPPIRRISSSCHSMRRRCRARSPKSMSPPSSAIMCLRPACCCRLHWPLRTRRRSTGSSSWPARMSHPAR